VTVQVTTPNRPATGADDVFLVSENNNAPALFDFGTSRALLIPFKAVLANDSDPDLDPSDPNRSELDRPLVSDPTLRPEPFNQGIETWHTAHGVLRVYLDHFEYMPNPGFVGTDSFRYSGFGPGDDSSYFARVYMNVLGSDPFSAFDPSQQAPNELVSALLSDNSGISIVPNSVAFIGGPGQSAVYDGSLSALGIGAGILLTTGDATPPLNEPAIDFREFRGTSGDATLTAILQSSVPGVVGTHDANVLTFSFTVDDPAAQFVTFKVVFGSDDYPNPHQYTFGSTAAAGNHVDISAVLVNNINVATFGNGLPFGVNSATLHSGQFIENIGATLPISYNGVTPAHTFFAPVQTGLNTIKIAIADGGIIDRGGDSGLIVSDLRAIKIIQLLAFDDEVQTGEAEPVVVNALANDVAPRTGEVLTITQATIADDALGQVSISSDGQTIIFDPGNDYRNLSAGDQAAVHVAYQVVDQHGSSATAVATVNIVGADDPPTAPAIMALTNEASSLRAFGLAPAGAMVNLFDNGGSVPIAAGQADALGHFEIVTSNALAEGDHILTAVASNGSGAASGPSLPAHVKVQNAGSNNATIHVDVTFTLGPNDHVLNLTAGPGATGVGNGLGNFFYSADGTHTLVGDGDDAYVVSHSNVTIAETLPGFDTVFSYVDFELPENVEVLVLLGSNAVRGEGNNADNFIYGGTGSNTLLGHTGNDFLIVNGSTFSLDGGTGFNSASWQNLPHGVSINLVDASSADGSVQNINVFYLSEFGDELVSANSAIFVYGFGGADTITGTPMSDIIDPGSGGDAVDGGLGFDYISYNTASSGVTVNLANPASNTGDAAGDTLIGIEAVVLSEYADTFVGATLGQNFALGYGGNDHLLGGLSANNALFGGAGDDFLQGGSLGDTLSGGAGSDTYSILGPVSAAAPGNPFNYAKSILDFTTGQDVMRLDSAGFGLTPQSHFVNGESFAVGTAAAQPAITGNGPSILYYRDSGIMYFDADGVGAQAAQLVAQFLVDPTTQLAPEVHASDFIVI
jgi:hypothetical protein